MVERMIQRQTTFSEINRPPHKITVNPVNLTERREHFAERVEFETQLANADAKIELLQRRSDVLAEALASGACTLFSGAVAVAINRYTNQDVLAGGILLVGGIAPAVNFFDRLIVAAELSAELKSSQVFPQPA